MSSSCPGASSDLSSSVPIGSNDALRILPLAAATLNELHFETWNFGDSVGFEAMLCASEVLGDDRWRAFAHGWARCWATRALPFRRRDCTAPGKAMVSLAERAPDEQLVSALVQLAEYLTARPMLNGLYETWESAPLMRPYGGEALPADEAALLADPPPGVFVDCLHFDPPFFTALGNLTNNTALVQIGIEQASRYVSLLQQPSGLFDHFALRGCADRTFGSAWGRGQGWALLGLLDVIEQMPAHDPARAELTAATARLIRAMTAYQSADGHWHAVITEPSSGPESSTAAFMTAGFLRAAKLGVVGENEVLPSVRGALTALVQATDSEGRLDGVSVAVLASTRPSHYARVPRRTFVPWGQGPLVLALAEWVAYSQSHTVIVDA